MASYVYEPLTWSQLDGTSGNTQIRLLDLPPGEPEGDIVCTLASYSLRDAPKYEAVSYCWGDPDDRAVIICDGKLLQVQSSVRDFLLRTRAKGTARTLWIDGICINQLDEVEKGHQVERMRDIYEHAERTLIWFGKGGPTTARAMDFAKTLFDFFALKYYGKDTPRPWYRRNEFSNRADWEAFSKLLDSPWFSRSWIVQEVAAAKDPWVLCGDKAIPWNTIVGALICTLQYQSWAFEQFSFVHINAIIMLKTSQNELESRKAFHHYQILGRHRAAEATDPRDKVYAFYGLSSLESFKKTGIKPDYTVATEEMFAQLAHATLQAQGESDGEKNLDYLSIPRLPSSLKLPSWAPDWSSKEDIAYSLLGLEALADGPAIGKTYNATHGSTCDLREAFDKDGGLNLKGCVIDRIASTSLRWDAMMVVGGPTTLLQQAEMLQERQRRVQDWEMVLGARSGAIYPSTGEPHLEVMWQTCMAGSFPDGKDKARVAFKLFMLRQNALLIFRILGLHGFVYTWVVVQIIAHVLRYLGIPNPETAFSLLVLCMNGRRAASTVDGYVGLVPGMAQVGDRVVLLQGGKLPFVLRPKGNDWELIGDAYVHGMMNGEKWTKGDCESIRIV